MTIHLIHKKPVRFNTGEGLTRFDKTSLAWSDGAVIGATLWTMANICK